MPFNVGEDAGGMVAREWWRVLDVEHRPFIWSHELQRALEGSRDHRVDEENSGAVVDLSDAAINRVGVDELHHRMVHDADGITGAFPSD